MDSKLITGSIAPLLNYQHRPKTRAMAAQDTSTPGWSEATDNLFDKWRRNIQALEAATNELMTISQAAKQAALLAEQGAQKVEIEHLSFVAKSSSQMYQRFVREAEANYGYWDDRRSGKGNVAKLVRPLAVLGVLGSALAVLYLYLGSNTSP